ncbi:MAG: hypothetical protein ACOX2W_12860 [Desulfomonilia bacterium]
MVAQPIIDETLDTNTKALEKISFIDSWYSGLNQLIAVLEAGNCPKAEGGKQFALNSFFVDDVIVNQEETIISNMFEVLKIPEAIYRFESFIENPSDLAGKVGF